MAGSIDVSFSGAVDTVHSGMGDVGDYSLWAITPATYTGGGVDNSPQEPDLIALNDGSAAGTQTLTFSQAVTNPVMAILSLGGPEQSVEYVFDKPFSILNYGPDAFGSGVSLSNPSGDTLAGINGSGIIQFSGTFSSINWTIPQVENLGWHAFQVAINPVPVPAAAWLFGSGLLGLLGIARRTKYGNDRLAQ